MENSKLIFLMEVRAWVEKTATTGQFYVPVQIRRDWLAWANKRIEYLKQSLWKTTP
jgi:hypothetical protein